MESFKPGEAIINYGEQGSKFYILLRGVVSIHKPIFIEKEMTLGDFVQYARNVKQHSPKVKYDRMKEMNNFLSLDIDYLIKKEEYQDHQSKFIFHIEEQEKINEMSQGSTFGEVALIKRSKRNATVIAQTACTLASIGKANYNKIIKECEEKKFEKNLNEVKRKYALFSSWTHHQLLGLQNCFTRLELMKGQFLYKQNTDPDGIYILESGSVEVFSLVSFDWINSLYEYIIESKTNLVYFLHQQFTSSKHPLKGAELAQLIEDLKRKAVKSPFQYDSFEGKHFQLSNVKKENIIDIKKEESSYNDPCHLIKVLIRNCSTPDVFGFVECIEFKKRLSFVKITSSSAIVQKVSLNDFYKLLNCIEEKDNWLFILDLIAKAKFQTNIQLQKQMKSKTRLIGEALDYKYDNAIAPSTKNDPFLRKLCLKIKGFGKYDKESIYYVAPSKSNSQSNRSRPMTNQSIEINSPKSLPHSQSQSESKPPLLFRHNSNVIPSSSKCSSIKGMKTNHLNIFYLYKTKPFCIHPGSETATANNSIVNTKQQGKSQQESSRLKFCSSSYSIQGINVFKTRQNNTNTISSPTLLNNCDKTSTITTIQQISRSNRRVKPPSSSSNRNSRGNGLFKKELFLSKDYIDHLNNQILHKTRSSLKEGEAMH